MDEEDLLKLNQEEMENLLLGGGGALSAPLGEGRGLSVRPLWRKERRDLLLFLYKDRRNHPLLPCRDWKGDTLLFFFFDTHCGDRKAILLLCRG